MTQSVQTVDRMTETDVVRVVSSSVFQMSIALIAVAAWIIPAGITLPWVQSTTDYRTLVYDQWRYDVSEIPGLRNKLCFAVHRIPDAVVTRFMFRNDWIPFQYDPQHLDEMRGMMV